jgi:hypothetical protein
MILSINQPCYLPWLGYFERLQASDQHVVLDHVQFEKNSFTNRNKIRTKEGSFWLTVPVSRANESRAIRDLQIEDGLGWRKKHQRSIQQHYSKAPYIDVVMDICSPAYEQSWRYLKDLCEFLNGRFLEYLGIDPHITYSSSMDLKSRKSDLVLEICLAMGASTYMSGLLGRDYLEATSFQEVGIDIVLQQYRHPEYPQVHGGSFLGNLSIIDLIANCGPESQKILASGHCVTRLEQN